MEKCLHRGIDRYTELARWLHHDGYDPLLWIHDLDAAYRQLPIQDIHRAFTMVNTPRGFTLWRHNCLSFGASGSVWSFNRFADMIQFIARKLLLIPCHHFVDDFAAFEPRPIATSGFQSFNDLFATLGLQMKAKKAASPGPKHKLLGVIVSIDTANITLEPCPSRCAKLLQTIQSALQDNILKPEQAQKLAGKLVFLQSTAFNNWGTVSHEAYIHSRAHNSSQTNHDGALNGPLRASLTFMQAIIKSFQPNKIPLAVEPRHTTLYTDAFFQLGDQKFSPSQMTPEINWSSRTGINMTNGWGFVASFGEKPLCGHGTFAKRKAFIYMCWNSWRHS